MRIGAKGRGGRRQDVTSEKSPEMLTKCIAAQIQLKFSARKAIKVLAPTQHQQKKYTERQIKIEIVHNISHE